MTWTRIIICVWVHESDLAWFAYYQGLPEGVVWPGCVYRYMEYSSNQFLACRLNQWEMIFKELQLYGVIERVLEPVVEHWPVTTTSRYSAILPLEVHCILGIRTPLMKCIRILRSGAGVWEHACVGWKSSPDDSGTMLTICHHWEMLVENKLRSKYCTKGSMDCLPILQKLCHCLLWLIHKYDLGIHKRSVHMFAHVVHCTRASGQHGEWGLKSSHALLTNLPNLVRGL